MLLACVMLFSVLVAPEVEAKEETVFKVLWFGGFGSIV